MRARARWYCCAKRVCGQRSKKTSTCTYARVYSRGRTVVEVTQRSKHANKPAMGSAVRRFSSLAPRVRNDPLAGACTRCVRRDTKKSAKTSTCMHARVGGYTMRSKHTIRHGKTQARREKDSNARTHGKTKQKTQEGMRAYKKQRGSKKKDTLMTPGGRESSTNCCSRSSSPRPTKCTYFCFPTCTFWSTSAIACVHSSLCICICRHGEATNGDRLYDIGRFGRVNEGKYMEPTSRLWV